MHQIPSNLTHVKTALDSKIMKNEPVRLSSATYRNKNSCYSFTMKASIISAEFIYP